MMGLMRYHSWGTSPWCPLGMLEPSRWETITLGSEGGMGS